LLRLPVGWAFLPDGRVVIDKNVPLITIPHCGSTMGIVGQDIHGYQQ